MIDVCTMFVQCINVNSYITKVTLDRKKRNQKLSKITMADKREPSVQSADRAKTV